MMASKFVGVGYFFYSRRPGILLSAAFFLILAGGFFVFNVETAKAGPKPPRTITASASAGGTISPSGVVTVANGGDKTFIITPEAGSIVSDVLVDSESVGAVNNYTFSNVTSDHTILANFNSGWSAPTVCSGNGINNPENAQTSNNKYVVFSSGSNYEDCGNFDLTISAGSIINGIEVSIEGKRSSPPRTFNISLSWDNGETWSASKDNLNLSATEETMVLGDSNDLWGSHSWIASDFNNGSFLVRIDANTASSGGNKTFSIDQLQVKVFYISNTAPVAGDDEAIVNEDDSLNVNVLANDIDTDLNTFLSVISVTTPAHGVAVIEDDFTITYTPDADYNGPDSFGYTISDGNGGTDTATVSIIVSPVNDASIANDDSYSTDEETTLLLVQPFDSYHSLLYNDIDNDSDASMLASYLVTDVTNGTLALQEDGGFTYTPNTDFVGVDSFTYRTFDGVDYSEPATVTIIVSNINDVPVANPDLYTLDEDENFNIDEIFGVLSNDVDVDTDSSELVASLVDDVSNGILIFNADGGFNYQPSENFFGQDTFTYHVYDGYDFSSEAVVTIIISPVNDEPIGEDGTVAVDEDASYTFKVPDFGFQDIDAENYLSLVRIESLPDKGAFIYQGENVTAGQIISTSEMDDGYLVYTPSADENGENYTGFDFSVADNSDSDNLWSVSTNRMTINVRPTNDVPVAVNDEGYTTDENTTLIVTEEYGVLSNDEDVDDDVLYVVVETNPEYGTLILNLDGGFTYIPEKDYTGSDFFTYKVFDGIEYSAAATVYINVNDMPPYVVSASANDWSTVKIEFNEELQSGLEGQEHQPTVDDFRIQHNIGDESAITIESVSYDDRIATLILSEPLTASDTPHYWLMPALASIVDLADNFALPQDGVIILPHTITASAGDNGAISPAGQTLVGDGDDQTFVIIANPGYHIVDVIVDQESQGAVSEYVFSNVTSGHVISATFVADETRQTIVGGGGGGGAVGGSGPIWGSVFQAPVGGFGVVINGGALGTNSTNVTLTLNGDTSVRMAISNTEDFSDAVQQTYKTSLPWMLTPGAGEKKVFVKFFNAAGTASPTVFDTINLVTGQVLGEKISRMDELLAITHYGERSENVRELQTELKKAGFFPSRQMATGYYGPITLASVKKYLATKKVLGIKIACIEDLLAITHYGERSENVRELQTELKKAGFFPSRQMATGYYGPITLASVKKYLANIK